MAAANNDICKIVQQNLNEYVEGFNPKMTQKGFYDALVSSLNRPINPVIDSVSRDRNGNTILRMRYWQGFAEGAATNSLLDVCVAGTPKAPRSQDYTIGQTASIKLSYTIEDYRNYCEGRESVMSAELVQAFDRVLKKKSDMLAASAVSYNLPYAESLRAGAAVDSVATPADAKFFESFTSGQISPLGVLTVLKEFSEADYDGAPILVGQGKLWHYAKLAQIACCNDKGQDVSQLGDGTGGDFAYFEDRRFSNIALPASTDLFMALRPGWFQQWTQPRFTGQYAIKKHDNDFNDTIVDPRSGETFDIQVRLNDCDYSQIDIVLSQNFDLFVMPNDIFDPADELSTYRGGVLFKAI